jgi:predicted metal-dependent peptidase
VSDSPLSAPGLDGLAAARLWAVTRFPYLASGVFGAQVIAERGSGAVSVDESWRMRADPELTAAWTPAQLGSVLVHHVCHLLRTHGERAQAFGVRPDEASTWVRAADAEINDDLVPAGLELPGRPVLPRDLHAADGLLAEQYFEGIRASAQEGKGGARVGPDLGGRSDDEGTADGWADCGSGADGMPRPGQQPGGLPPWQADLIRRQVALDVVAHGKLPGTVPAGLLRWAQEVMSPKVNWRVLLAAELRRAVAEVAGAVDYSYRRPSRRSSVAGQVVLPALRRPVPEVAVVCDTSGSMTADLLAMVLAEVEGLLRTLGLARQVRVLACDTAVGPAQRVNSARQVQLIGGGGTDMRAGIAAAAALRPRPAVTVVLTDGYTPWPAEQPKGMRIVVGLIGPQARDAPSWARAVRVEAELATYSKSLIATARSPVGHRPAGWSIQATGEPLRYRPSAVTSCRATAAAEPGFCPVIRFRSVTVNSLHGAPVPGEEPRAARAGRPAPPRPAAASRPPAALPTPRARS